MVRTARKEREYRRRESEILDASLGLFDSPEFESVTMEQIATCADVGKGTLYNHFNSKDELLFRLNMRFYRGLLDDLRDLESLEGPTEQVRYTIAHAFHYHLNHADYRYVVTFCNRLDFIERAEESWRNDLLLLDSAFQEWGCPIIEAGMAAGEFQRRPVEPLLLGTYACFDGAVTMLWSDSDWYPLAKGIDKERLVESFTDFIVAALTGEVR